ncbi:hypothetical protein ACFQZJ_15375 [Maribacter chungangensis]|uniref:SnoaL-like domain-containing protein n=1 Tax=Maribacter chungangensis TaxID=1069117 RepID=A0ABW3B6C6_9FLAO
MMKTKIILLLLGILSLGSCKQEKSTEIKTIPPVNFEQEKKAILETLQSETTVAFQRNYEAWTEKWVHDENISKTYINFEDSTHSEAIGWNKISAFVKAFMEEHPEPEPAPKLVNDIDVRLYGNGAWVSFEQVDSLRGLKRETRLMEKIEGQWKIAGMHTTIYGFDKNK